MKVGLVTTSFPREPGDPAGSFVGSHVRWLRRAGHDVDVVAAGGGNGATHESLDANVTRVASKLFYRGGAPEALEAGGITTMLSAAGFSLRQLAAVRRQMRGWDAVCAHWLAPCGLAVAALNASRRKRLPFLAIAHSGDVHLLRRLKLCRAAARLLARSQARLAFSSGPLATSFLENAGGHRKAIAERSLVSPMGVELTDPALLPTNVTGSTFRVLFLGRLVAIKGVDVLIDAFARLSKDDAARPANNGSTNRPKFELVICGDGPERVALEARANAHDLSPDQIHFVGEVRGPNRDHFLSSADLLVAPSRALETGRTEGMPVVVLEAIASNTPVIVSASGGMLELPESVPKVTPGDVGELASALREMANPDVRRLALSRQAPIAAAQQWDRVGTVLWRHWIG